MDMDEMMENADFARDTDEYNMYPNSDGFSSNVPQDELTEIGQELVRQAELESDIEDPVNDWEREAFFEIEEASFGEEPLDEGCGCPECTSQDTIAIRIMGIINFPPADELTILIVDELDEPDFDEPYDGPDFPIDPMTY